MVWKKKLRSPQYTFNSEKVFLVATQPGKSIYSYLQTTKLGLTQGEVQERQSIYGRNEVIHEQKKNPFILFIKTFINPFIGVLTGLAIISLFLDVLMADPGEQEWTGVIIISSMVLFSAILRFWQEWRASEATDSLMKMVKNTCLAKRAGEHEEEIEITELVPGDIVYLAACCQSLFCRTSFFNSVTSDYRHVMLSYPGIWFLLTFGSSIRKTCSSVRLH